MNGHNSYEFAKMRMAEEHRWAANERLAHEARKGQHHKDEHDVHQGVGFSLRRLITQLSWT
jgi:hypothetical protein